MEFCNNTTIPVGTRIKIIRNFGNQCEPFLNLFGIAKQPFRTGCCKQDWIGVELEKETMYGKKFNFHIKEIEIVS